jgi:hypothetical protein
MRDLTTKISPFCFKTHTYTYIHTHTHTHTRKKINIKYISRHLPKIT